MANKKAFLQRFVESVVWNFNLEDPNQKIDGKAIAEIFGGSQSQSGESVSEEKALNFSAVWAANRAIADPISYLPVNIYKRESDGTRTLQPFDEHAFLFRQPNGYTTWNMLINRFITHRNLWGNGLLKINMVTRGPGAGNVKSIEPIHPSLLQKIEVENGKAKYIINNKDGKSVEVPGELILHLPGLGDSLMGKSVIQHAKEDIGLEFALQRYGNTIYKEGGDPRGAMFLKHNLNGKQITEMMKAVQDQRKNGKTMIIPSDGDYKQFSMKPADAEFISSRSFNVNTIARWFGVPPWKIAHLQDGATFNNIEAQGIAFLQDTLAPIVSAIEAEFNNKIFDNEYFMEFDMNSYLRADSHARAEQYRTGIQNGYYTINEVRKENGMNPIEGGDKAYIQKNMMPIDKVDDIINSETNGKSTD